MTHDDVIGDIKRLYFAATKATIGRDFDRAIDLLKSLPSDEAREAAAVYMDGLAQLRSEWGPSKSAPPDAGTAAGPSPARRRDAPVRTVPPARPAKRATSAMPAKRR